MILLVEDNVIDQKAFKRAFATTHDEDAVVTATNGEDALQLLNDGSVQKPFIIVLDLNLPKLDGLAFLKELRTHPTHRNATVFVLSTSDEEVEEAYALNVAGYFRKDGVGPDFVRLVKLLKLYLQGVVLPS